MRCHIPQSILWVALFILPGAVAWGAGVTPLDGNEGYSCKPAALRTQQWGLLNQFSFCQLSSSSGSADVPGRQNSSPPLSLAQVLKLGLDADASIAAQQLAVQSAKYQLQSAKGSWWPSVSMSNSSVLFTDIRGNGLIGSSPATAGTSINPFNGSGSSNSQGSSNSSYTQIYPVVTIQWNLINPVRYPQIAAARKQLELADSQLRQTRSDRSLSLTRNYYLYLLNGYQAGELLKLIQIQNQILTDTNKRLSSGLLPRYIAQQTTRDLLSYQSRLESAKLNQLNAESNVLAALNTASRESSASDPRSNATNLDQALENLAQAGLSPNIVDVQVWPHSRNETLALAEQHSENLKQLQLQAGIAKDNANQQWGSILPTIGLLGYATYQGTIPDQPAGSYSGSLANYAGLSITWNLFDGYATRNQAKSYQKTEASFQKQLLDGKSQLSIQIQTLLNQLNANVRMIHLLLQATESAAGIASDLEIRQRVGYATSIDQLESAQDVHESRLQLLDALAQYVSAYLQLASLCGFETGT